MVVFIGDTSTISSPNAYNYRLYVGTTANTGIALNPYKELILGQVQILVLWVLVVK